MKEPVKGAKARKKSARKLPYKKLIKARNNVRNRKRAAQKSRGTVSRRNPY